MKFPQHIYQLIREFSKPLTRPDWKKGTPHAKLIKYSVPMKVLKKFICESTYWSYNLSDQYINDIHTTDIIQLYGEEIFPIHCGFNFYIYIRRFLKQTQILQLKKFTRYIQKCSTYPEEWIYYEYVWEYVKK
jgi:hypothetical protein